MRLEEITLTDNDYSKYLKTNGKLDFQLLWKDLADITGFWHEPRRKSYYEAVTEWYEQHTSDDRSKQSEDKGVSHAQ